MFRKVPYVLCMIFFAALISSPADCRQAQAPAPNPTASQPPAPAASDHQPANPPQQPPGKTKPPDAPAAAWELLSHGVGSDKAHDRSDALSALTILRRDPRAISLIEKGLDDKDEKIRVLAVTSLGEMKAREAIPRLRAALDDKSPEVSFTAAQALLKMGDRSGREIIYEVLDGERKTKPGMIKGKITSAEKEMHDPKALALLGVNQASGALLGPFSMGLSFMEEYVKKTGAPVQAYCAQLLASDASPATVAELTGALTDKNWAVRAAAARALAKLNRTEAALQLEDMMQNDKEKPARFVAAAALLQLSEHMRKESAFNSPAVEPPSAGPSQK